MGMIFFLCLIQSQPFDFCFGGSSEEDCKPYANYTFNDWTVDVIRKYPAGSTIKIIYLNTCIFPLLLDFARDGVTLTVDKLESIERPFIILAGRDSRVSVVANGVTIMSTTEIYLNSFELVDCILTNTSKPIYADILKSDFVSFGRINHIEQYSKKFILAINSFNNIFLNDNTIELDDYEIFRGFDTLELHIEASVSFINIKGPSHITHLRLYFESKDQGDLILERFHEHGKDDLFCIEVFINESKHVDPKGCMMYTYVNGNPAYSTPKDYDFCFAVHETCDPLSHSIENFTEEFFRTHSFDRQIKVLVKDFTFESINFSVVPLDLIVYITVTGLRQISLNAMDTPLDVVLHGSCYISWTNKLELKSLNIEYGFLGNVSNTLTTNTFTLSDVISMQFKDLDFLKTKELNIDIKDSIKAFELNIDFIEGVYHMPAKINGFFANFHIHQTQNKFKLTGDQFSGLSGFNMTFYQKVNVQLDNRFTHSSLHPGEFICINAADSGILGSIKGGSWLFLNGNLYPFEKISDYDFCLSNVTHGSHSCDGFNASTSDKWGADFIKEDTFVCVLTNYDVDLEGISKGVYFESPNYQTFGIITSNVVCKLSISNMIIKMLNPDSVIMHMNLTNCQFSSSPDYQEIKKITADVYSLKSFIDNIKGVLTTLFLVVPSLTSVTFKQQSWELVIYDEQNFTVAYPMVRGLFRIMPLMCDEKISLVCGGNGHHLKALIIDISDLDISYLDVELVGDWCVDSFEIGDTLKIAVPIYCVVPTPSNLPRGAGWLEVYDNSYHYDDGILGQTMVFVICIMFPILLVGVIVLTIIFTVRRIRPEEYTKVSAVFPDIRTYNE